MIIITAFSRDVVAAILLMCRTFRLEQAFITGLFYFFMFLCFGLYYFNSLVWAVLFFLGRLLRSVILSGTNCV